MSDQKPPRGLFFAKADQASNGDRIPFAFDEKLRSLEEWIGHVFADKKLLEEALTHSTYAYEHRNLDLTDNERLEFLGDAVLDLAISDALFRNPEMFSEGFMTKMRALVVREITLAQLARELGIGQLLLLGKGEEATGGRDKPSNLANAIEAVFGAIYLDAGFEKACHIIQTLLQEPLRLALAGELVYDYKSHLIEWVQGLHDARSLQFVILDESGPVHERFFKAGVFIDDRLIATGTGCSKKEAEQQAAQKALRELDQKGLNKSTEDDTAGG